MRIDSRCLLTPDLTAIMEQTNQFLLLCIHTDDRPAQLAKDLPLRLDMPELLIAVRVRLGSQMLHIALGANVVLTQQTPQRLTTDAMSQIDQRLPQFAQTLAQPTHATDWITRHLIPN